MCHVDWLGVLDLYQYYLFAELAWSAFTHYLEHQWDAGSLTGIYYPREV